MEYTAHIRESDHMEQSVEEHCRRTAMLAARYGKDVGLEKTAEAAGYLHDIGKLSSIFNAYIHEENTCKRGDIDHSFAGAKYLKELLQDPKDKNLQKTISLIGRVILSHHGLHDWMNEKSKDTYAIRTEKEDQYSEIRSNFKASELSDALERILPDAVDEVMAIRADLKKMAGNSLEQLAFYLGMMERLLQSILIDADRTDTADFMSDSRTEICFDTDSLWKEMDDKLEEKLHAFSDRTDTISRQRQSISDRCAAFASQDVHICKLIVPTGGGKTLSSLRFAVKHVKEYHKKKILYIAPFMSILEQNGDAIREITGEAAFLEHHSDVLAEIADDRDMLHAYELRTEKWDSPVIATTMVQFLNALFSGKTSAVRRMHRLSEAVIIIDEVQSIPLKCVYLFNLAMNFLSQVCKCTIVLCSATQPPFEELNEFPMLLDECSSMTGDTVEDFAAFRRTKLLYREKKGGWSYDEAADFCSEKFLEHGNLLLIVNTKAAAKALYQRLRNTENASVFHLSTNMCPAHRRSCIRKMKEQLEPHSPVICVTTQLIEAGVDISFGCVVRSLAGMDNAVQAAGRCNRHGENETVCPVYMLYLWEEKLGSLAEIKNAANISREIADTAEDLDDVHLLVQYFLKLYNTERDKLRYPLPENTDQDLINLLSLNRGWVDKKKHPHLRFCGQAFKKAGGYFEVIDSNTSAVIVPYDAEAKELIADLCSEQNPKRIAELLRRAQRFCVNVYAGTEYKLEQEAAIDEIQCGKREDCTVKILQKPFYDNDFGLTTESGLHEVLMM
ncbi:MAG: CRISPR-associated helicase Cas3' [Oscillospiraceae bacterium]|nr:CRISPR-associated helicase Cas3' [Oscillospiraceae bacterium]